VLALVNADPPRLDADRPRPTRGAGEARLRMRIAGVCDTDLQLARGYLGFSGVLGHELVGEVIEADDPGWVGQRVVADINAGCGECPDCTTARGHHCARRSVLGILGRDGAFAEELAVPERCLVAVPDRVPDEQAVFAEPLAAALHVLDESPEGPVVVLGDGKLGQLVARALLSAGLATIVVGRHAQKLALAAAAGADTLLEADVAQLGRVPSVVEATGSAAGLSRALSLVAPRGLLVLKTTVAGPVELDLAPIVIDEIRVVGSRCGDLGRAIDVLASGTLDPTPLIAGRYPLNRADEALRHAGQRGTLKILIENG
jgi:threonine dehydrogenase-like Zn-dependent dehydrogenase